MSTADELAPELLPCNHPSVAGREPELRALADVVRRLMDLTVTNTADPDQTVEITERLRRVADDLATLVPDPLPPRLSMDRPAHGRYDGMPYDVVIGHYNPLAVPVTMSVEGNKAVGTVHFTTPYEGPPACVHGGVLASVFDMVLTMGNMIHDVAGPTMELTIRYRKPTRLHVETRFEAWVAETTGRVTTTAGHALQGDTVTVEAIGKFIKLDREDVMRLSGQLGDG